MKKINLITIVLILVSCLQIYGQTKLTLEESKELALVNNADSKNSKLEAKAASQVRNSALTNYFPKISASGIMFGANEDLVEMETEGGNLPVYDGNPVNLLTPTQFAYMPSSSLGLLKKGTFGMINAVQPIFMGGRIIYGNKLASLGEDAANYKSKITTDAVALSTEEQYWHIVALEEKMLTVKKYEEMLDKLYIQVKDAYNSGIVMKNDLLKVKLKQNEVLLNESKLENGISLSKMAFCNHIGIAYDSSLALTDSLVINNLPLSYYVDNEEALEKRSEYNLLKLSVEAEETKTSMKLGEFLPQAAVGVSGVCMKIDESDSRTLGMVFATVNVPISDWWSGAYELEERSIHEEIAENNMQNKTELLLLQMEKAWKDLTDSYKQYLLSLEAKEQAEENLKVNDDSYKNGLITVADLLEAQALEQESEDKLTDSMANYKIKLTTYLQVTGR